MKSLFSNIFLSKKSLQEMKHVLELAAQGDYSKRILLPSSGKMGELAKALNHMLDDVNAQMEEMRLGKSRLQAVLLSMFEGVMVVDKQGTILLMNQTLRNFLHVVGEGVGRKPLEIIRNIEIQEITEKVLNFRTIGLESKEVSVLLPQERILLIHATPVIRDGKVDGAVLVFHDMTELRRLERVRQDFVANVSHELRTPISTIKGYAETLLDGALADQENAKDFLRIIYSDADRLAKLIDDLLDLSRLESGVLKLNLKDCSLEVIMDRVIKILEKPAQEKSITIHKNISSDLASIKVDETAMGQVFFNLIENAIKYNKSGGSVSLSLEQKDFCVEVSIKDTGMGIPQEDLPRIFERFYRVDKAHSRQIGGTGLGLSIVKHIIGAHRGEIAVESRLAEGTTFHFILPQ